MTPQDALAKALREVQPPDPEWVESITGGGVPSANWPGWADRMLAALAADGWTVARTQDARDGEALARLRDAAQATGGRAFIHHGWTDATVWTAIEVNDHPDSGRPRVYKSGSGPTFATAADACREAIEATR